MTDDHEDCYCPVCSGQMTVGDYQRRVLENIDRTGLSITGVFADESTPSFVYSIGLHRSGMPDLIAFSLPHDYGMALLNYCYLKAKAGELELKDGTVISDPEMTRIPMVLKATDPELAADYAVGAVNLSTEENRRDHDRLGVPDKGANPVLQVVWADRDGRFPWDPGFAKEFDGKQVKLWVTRN